MVRRFGPYRVQTKYTVTLPEELAKALSLQPGDLFVWMIERKRVTIRKCFLMNGEGGVAIE